MTIEAASLPVACLIGGSEVRLWGLEGAARLRRQLRALGVAQIVAEEALPLDRSILLLRADYLFDDRTLRELAARPGTVLVPGGGASEAAAAAHVSGEAARVAAAALRGKTAASAVPGATVCTSSSLSSAYVGALLKAAPPMVVRIRPERRAALERYLFDGSYKGVTDLVTKWVWPAPARQAVHLCTRLGIGPNAVTTTSLVLVLTVIALFADGHFGVGLLLGWTMTFLDTVDGKLARVTVTSTRAGHYFDHLMDLIHPPFWYIAWAYGVAGDASAFRQFTPLLVTIVIAYIAGRLAEAAFKWYIGTFSMFTWRPVDSYIRLIMARRNPNLLWLTGFALCGNLRGGLAAVTVWTVLSSLVLWLRVAQGVAVRAQHGPLRPWLADLEADRTEVPWYARPFAPDLSVLRQLVV